MIFRLGFSNCFRKRIPQVYIAVRNNEYQFAFLRDSNISILKTGTH